MAYNNYQQFPFWDFVRSFDPQHGAGVDHPVGGDFSGPHQPPHFGGFGGPFGWGRGGFGAGPWHGRGGHRGRHGRHGGRRGGRGSRSPPPQEGEPSEGEPSEGEQSDGPTHGRRGHHRGGSHGRRGHDDAEHSEGEAREGSPHGRRGHGRHGRGRGGRHEHGRGGRGGRGHPRGPPPPFPGGFDMNGLIAALSSHPLAQTFRNYAEQAGAYGVNPERSGETLVPEDDANDFVPPIDIFSTEKAYVLHISLPGAKKEDVGVHWDEDKGVLNVAGVVYRQGDEEFLQTLAQSERKVGVFERAVKLPPGDAEKEEVDGDLISAKLENGILVVTVPKVEKEWTEVKKVDIE